MIGGKITLGKYLPSYGICGNIFTQILLWKIISYLGPGGQFFFR